MFAVPVIVSSLAASEVINAITAKQRCYLYLAALAAVGRISDELILAVAAVPSFGAGKDKLPVLRRRLVGSLATLAFLMDARLLS